MSKNGLSFSLHNYWRVTENEASHRYQDGVDLCAVSNRVRVGLGPGLGARKSFTANCRQGIPIGISCRQAIQDVLNKPNIKEGEHWPEVAQIPPGSVDVTTLTTLLQVIVIAWDEVLGGQSVMQLARRRNANAISSHACNKHLLCK